MSPSRVSSRLPSGSHPRGSGPPGLPVEGLCEGYQGLCPKGVCRRMTRWPPLRTTSDPDSAASDVEHGQEESRQERLPEKAAQRSLGASRRCRGQQGWPLVRGRPAGTRALPRPLLEGETWQLLKLLEGRGQGSRVPFCKRQCRHCGCGDDSLPRRWEVWKLHLC